MRDINDDEALDFASITYKEGWHVRFIELMPFRGIAGFVPSGELRQRIMSIGSLVPCSPAIGNGPARCYHLPGAKGTLCFISPITEPFCSRCNRLRLTSEGRLCPCLLWDSGIDLKGPLRSNASIPEIESLILKAVASKPEHHHLAESTIPINQNMSRIGG
jgi:Molybdenum cofactor biosynthesis enzyme